MIARRLFCLVAIPALLGAAAPERGGYALALLPSGAVVVTRDGERSVYLPQITVVAAGRDPKLRLSRYFTDPRDYDRRRSPEAYQLPQWRVAGGDDKSATDQLFRAGAVTILRGDTTIRRADGTIEWRFKDDAAFRIVASVSPDPAGGPPVIGFRFTARKPGWYSVGYTGGPAADARSSDAVLQPLIWQEKRFPRAPLLTVEGMGGLPVTLVTTGGVTRGLSVDPVESPFRLPTLDNSRFGVMLRNPAGEAQPSAFAPVLGQAASRLDAGQSVTFAMRPILKRAPWFETYEEVARTLFDFGDRRENAEWSLNDTIDTMTRFAMDDVYAGWNDDLKGFDYETDVKGTVKVVSALHPLSVALIQDDLEIYRRRALPVTEYLLSRTKYLYNADPKVDGQNAARDMKGPAAEISELVALDRFTHGANPIFRYYALSLADKPRALNLMMVSRSDDFWTRLALYHLTGGASYLDEARALADAYIARRIDTAQSDFADARLAEGGQFWSDFAPRWVELYELWEATREPRYFAAAAKGARLHATYSWLFPRIPRGMVTVDRSGAPVGWEDGILKTPMVTPPRTLPAWRVSQVGLTPEASTTYGPNPAIFLAPHAAYFLRIAAASGRNGLLHDIARSAIVGRYANYPGYDINGAFSDVYARKDYPLRPFDRFSYNQIYYNHVWPNIALLLDYLVSDVETRSGGQIAFPSQFAQGYAYLKSKVYGDRPGVFMGDRDVRLWMPRGIVTTGSPQLNYLTGYGNGRFYIVFLNESDRAISTTFTLDSDRLPYVPGRGHEAQVWQEGKPAGTGTVRNGGGTVSVAPRGITAFAISGLQPFTTLQKTYFERRQTAVDDPAFHVGKVAAGIVTGMILRLPLADRHLYVWSSASDADIRAAQIAVEQDGASRTFSDGRHPFEFSVPVGGDPVRYRLTVIDRSGRRTDGEWVTLGGVDRRKVREGGSGFKPPRP